MRAREWSSPGLYINIALVSVKCLPNHLPMDITRALNKLEQAIKLDGEQITIDLTQIANDYEKGNSLLTSDQYTSVCVILDCLRKKESPE